MHRKLSQTNQGRYTAAFAPYLRGHAGQYIYRLKPKEFPEHVQRIGEFMHCLLGELKEGYSAHAVHPMFERVFHDHFRVEGASAKAHHELSATCMQSPDDLEATFRKRSGKEYHGYVANLTETCDLHNEVQLLTKVRVTPNHTSDSHLLAEALPNLKQRMDLDTLDRSHNTVSKASFPGRQVASARLFPVGQPVDRFCRHDQFVAHPALPEC